MKNQKQKPSWFLNQFSKIKTWCGTHRNTALAVLLVSFVLIAIAALLIGGTVAGWDIKGALTSPTATLVYVVLLLISAVTIYFFATGRHGRW